MNVFDAGHGSNKDAPREGFGVVPTGRCFVSAHTGTEPHPC
ncbi:hypothetical protein LMG27952_04864 [Paraburkholderia hiiakae]|uniref:Uncharacterized protein n=1 Tax=Paraburkholderia hiiakae TaxID=1081782 RepID=A0ABM8NYI4_9BURK|nr:hypothetical protein LMG27952_04864 [Paraburkholderia hiiakae]